MQIRVIGIGVVELPGVGLIEAGKWVDVTPEQEALFELLHGYTLEASTIEKRSAPEPELSPLPKVKPKPRPEPEPEPEPKQPEEVNP